MLSFFRAGMSISTSKCPLLATTALPFMTRKCPKITSNGCYWRDKDGEPPNLSFYAIPVGKKKCIVYWFRADLRFCTKPGAKVAPALE